MRNKRLIAAGITAGLLGGGAAGMILEATGSVGASSARIAESTVPTDPNASTTDSTLAGTTATTTGTPGTTMEDRETARWQEVLAPLIADGTLTQDQVTKVIAALQGARHPLLTKAAEILGMTADELRTEIQSGKTIAAVATAKGKTAQNVIDGLVAATKAKLDAAVAAGDLTQKQADKRLAKATEMITTMVNETRPQMKGLGHGGGKHGRGQGRDGLGPDQAGGPGFGGPGADDDGFGGPGPNG